MKLTRLLVLFSLLNVVGCSNDSGSSSRSDADSNNAFNPDDFVVTQSVALEPFGESGIQVRLQNLASDDPVYVSVNSSDQENGELILKPYRMIVNPSEGAAEFNVMLKDNGLASQPSLKVSITTSGNRLMEQEIAVAFEE